MAAPAPMHREAVALRALALALAFVAVLSVLSRIALSALLLRLATGDEGRQATDVVVVATMMTLAAALLPATLLLRPAAVLLLALLIARREELGIARQIRLRIAGAERRLLAAALAALHRRARALVLAVVERLVLHVVAAMRVVAALAFGPIEVRLVLAELLLYGRDHAEIVLGMLIIVLGCHRIAGRLRVARELDRKSTRLNSSHMS